MASIRGSRLLGISSLEMAARLPQVILLRTLSKRPGSILWPWQSATNHGSGNRSKPTYSRSYSSTANLCSALPSELANLATATERPLDTHLASATSFKEDQNVQDLLSSLPLVRYLRSADSAHSTTGAPAHTELCLHSDIHQSAVSTHLVGGSLLGQDKLPIWPRLFVRDSPTVGIIAVCYIGARLCGHPGYVHGGLPFVLFDDLFARCASMTFDSGVGMTANMNMQFRKPSIPDRAYILRVNVEKREGRKIWIQGSMRCLDSFTAEQMGRRPAATTDRLSAEEDDANLVAEATSLFVEPKFASSMVPLFQRR